MQKVYEKKILEIGYKRCNKCGMFTPQKLYISSIQKTFLSFPIGKEQTTYYITCPGCKKNIEVSEDELQKYRDFTKQHIPYEHQKAIWKEFYNTHKNYAEYEDQLSFKEFFELIKEKALENIQIQISEKEFNYLFNAYLTNYMKARQEKEEEPN